MNDFFIFFKLLTNRNNLCIFLREKKEARKLPFLKKMAKENKKKTKFAKKVFFLYEKLVTFSNWSFKSENW